MLVEGNEAAMANIPEVCDGHTLSQDGLTPLHAAALCGAPSAAVEALLRRGVSPHVTTPDNMTPADLARQQGQDSVIKGLQHHHCVQIMGRGSDRERGLRKDERKKRKGKKGGRYKYLIGEQQLTQTVF
ncbi:uncharacterized protein LOC135098307 isoform X4 [Scylla paramamosain]|uniref:uncharacterized protein LOC135098307 isoform X4 n=1 Tax=Scylla paramamosain TaxID=85552 RepID=UPI00308348F5